MFEAGTIARFVSTAIAEIVGGYLPLLGWKHSAPVGVPMPAALSLAVFVWLLTLHPLASGRVCAACGGVHVATAPGWHWLVDGIRPTVRDVAGVLVVPSGTSLIAFGPRHV